MLRRCQLETSRTMVVMANLPHLAVNISPPVHNDEMGSTKPIYSEIEPSWVPGGSKGRPAGFNKRKMGDERRRAAEKVKCGVVRWLDARPANPAVRMGIVALPRTALRWGSVRERKR